jgi:formylglycine-generating enzyme required for sulfatase activity
VAALAQASKLLQVIDVDLSRLNMEASLPHRIAAVTQRTGQWPQFSQALERLTEVVVDPSYRAELEQSATEVRWWEGVTAWNSFAQRPEWDRIGELEPDLLDQLRTDGETLLRRHGELWLATEYRQLSAALWHDGARTWEDVFAELKDYFESAQMRLLYMVEETPTAGGRRFYLLDSARTEGDNLRFSPLGKLKDIEGLRTGPAVANPRANFIYSGSAPQNRVSAAVGQWLDEDLAQPEKLAIKILQHIVSDAPKPDEVALDPIVQAQMLIKVASAASDASPALQELLAPILADFDEDKLMELDWVDPNSPEARSARDTLTTALSKVTDELADLPLQLAQLRQTVLADIAVWRNLSRLRCVGWLARSPNGAFTIHTPPETEPADHGEVLYCLAMPADEQEVRLVRVGSMVGDEFVLEIEQDSFQYGRPVYVMDSPIMPATTPKLLSAPFAAADASVAQAAWAEYLGTDVTSENSIGMKMVLIPPGEFPMGSPNGEEDRRGDEKQHSVRLSTAFFVGQTEVTKGQFAEFVRDTGYKTEAETDGKGGYAYVDGNWEQDPQFIWRNAGFTQGDDHPVVNVSWNDAQKFCEWLSSKEGVRYRLPTEAEWEYACRAGTSTPFHFGDELHGGQANFDGNYPYGTSTEGPYLERTTTVGSYSANAFGVFDMHGNVWEWCGDWYASDYFETSGSVDPRGPSTGSSRVVRGGSWSSSAIYCRSASRVGYEPSYRNNGNGFRVVCEL